MIMLELIAKYHKLPPMHKTPSYSQLKRSDTLSGYTQSLQVSSIHREGTRNTKVWICFLNSSKSPVFKLLQLALLIPASVSMEFRLESLHPRPRRACLLLGAQGAGWNGAGHVPSARKTYLSKANGKYDKDDAKKAPQPGIMLCYSLHLYSMLFRLNRKCSPSAHCLQDYGGEFSGQTLAELIGSNAGWESGQSTIFKWNPGRPWSAKGDDSGRKWPNII